MSLRPRTINFEEKWTSLVDTLKGVITLNRLFYVSRAAWSDKFSDIYSICIASPSSYYEDLYVETEKFLRSHVNSIYQEIASQNSDALLTTYCKYWSEYRQGALYLNSLFGYLNNHYVKKRPECDLAFGLKEPYNHNLEVGDLAMKCWGECLLAPLKNRIVSIVLDEIKLHRQKDTTVDCTTAREAILSFVYCFAFKERDCYTFYQREVESLVISETGEFYSKLSNQLLSELDCSQYMAKAVQLLAEEDARCRLFLHKSSLVPVNAECHARLVIDHIQILQNESKEMVANENKEGLSNLYVLMKRVPEGLQLVIQEVQSHIKKILQADIADISEENIHVSFVEKVLATHSHFSKFIQKVFNGDQLFFSAMGKAFSSVINSNWYQNDPCRSAEMLSKFLDSLLRKSSRQYNETELDEKLSQSIILFTYLDDKDLFHRLYAQRLARRLIYSLYVSMDAEESMINKLKQCCGFEFTNKLQRMFTDISVSNGLMESFGTYLKTNNVTLDIGFNVLVLQSGSWPLSCLSIPEITFPVKVEKAVRSFEDFYRHSFSGRKLTWLHSQSNADIYLNYLDKNYIVTANAYQMTVLLCFEPPQDRIALKSLQEMTHLPRRELLRAVRSLVDARIFCCDQQIDENTMDTEICLNLKFSSKRSRIKVFSSAITFSKDDKAEALQARSSIDEDRKLFLQATIVRIMKARKTEKHNQLVEEIIQQSQQRFLPSIPMIKRCIEILIEKAYLKRSDVNNDEYIYVA